MKNKTKKGAKNVGKKKSAVKMVAAGSSTAKVQPLGDRVLVRPLSEEYVKKTSSGIIIPDTAAKEKPEQGEVIAVGPGRHDDGKRVPMQVAVGDMIVFSRYGYDEIKIDGVEYYMIKEENILGILN